MDWVHHEILFKQNQIEPELSLEIKDIGLDATAQDMHARFLADLPHLREVERGHSMHIGEVSAGIDSAKIAIRDVNDVEDLLREFDGEMDERSIRINFPSARAEDIVVQTMIEQDSQLVRIISPERFGGLLRTFRLPPEQRMESVRLEDGILSFLLE